MDDWLLPGASRDPQSVTSDWKLVGQQLLDGVRVFESRNVVRATRTLAEIWRADWRLDDLPVDQLFQVVVEGGAVSAWHAHAQTTDRLFVASGCVHLALYDSRPDSSTNGKVNEFHLSDRRPMLVVVPPRVWHGMVNRTARPALVLNLTDKAYSYDSPDHWRVPPDSPHIPFKLV